MNKREEHIVTGMTRDMSAHRVNHNFLVDARNIRITARQGNSSLLSVTNEKGTAKFYTDTSLNGVVLGSAVLNNTLILFTCTRDESTNYIYSVTFNVTRKRAHVNVLFSGQLNFSLEHPIETIPLYENEQVQKVYWVDGYNQPRMINLSKGIQYNPDVFNFLRQMELNHTFTVLKHDSGGSFGPGTIQYAFSYFDKFGQETAVAEVSPLYYLCPTNRGLAADDRDGSSFEIDIVNMDQNFEYVRIYSIYRSSEGASPVVKLLGDYKGSFNMGKFHWTYSSGIPISQGVVGIKVSKNSLFIMEPYHPDDMVSVLSVHGTPSSQLPFVVDLSGGKVLYDSSAKKVYAWFEHATSAYDILDYIAVTYSDNYYYIQSPINSSRLEPPKYLGTAPAEIKRSLNIVDTGTFGSVVDPSFLLFLGGQKITVGTFAAKDNTLFLGNIKTDIPSIRTLVCGGKPIQKYIQDDEGGTGGIQSIWFDENGYPYNSSQKVETEVSDSTLYEYTPNNNKSSFLTKSFKSNEGYRLGFVAQTKYGTWSDVIWVGDYIESLKPIRMEPVWASAGQKHFRYNCGFTYELDSNLVHTLVNAGYVRIAPVAVYPNEKDRFVICQGILAGTVFNVEDRAEDAPFVQADWLFRWGYSWSAITDEIQLCSEVGNMKYPSGTGSYFRRNRRWVPDIPAMWDEDNQTKFNSETFSMEWKEWYYRDPHVLTFHSPDIEFSDSYIDSDFKNTSLRLVGACTGGYAYTSQTDSVSPLSPKEAESVFLETETPGWAKSAGIVNTTPKLTLSRSARAAGWKHYFYGRAYYRDYAAFRARAVYGISTTISGVEILDNITVDTNVLKTNGVLFDWNTFLWHREGSLNSQDGLTTADKEAGIPHTALLKNKTMALFDYGYTTYFNIPSAEDEPIDLLDVKLFDFDQTAVVKLNSEEGGISYYGNIDKVLTPNLRICPSAYTPDEDTTNPYDNNRTVTIHNDKTDGYQITTDMAVGYEKLDGVAFSFLINSATFIPDKSRALDAYQTIGNMSKEPVHIRYKSTKHLVLSFKDFRQDMYTLSSKSIRTSRFYWTPEAPDSTSRNTHNGLYFLQSHPEYFSQIGQNIGDVSFDTDGILIIADLCRNMTEIEKKSRFGGNTNDAILSNDWVMCGEPVYLDESKDSISVYFREGDTYVERYDCLKTYPFAEGDKNSIVSILSCELESRVHLDAKYDKNRGLIDNTLVTPQNFNLFNRPGYEQTNQYFTYHYIDLDRFNVINYPNMITWSLEKTMGEDVDTWTKVNLTSTLDLDGDKGEITKLINHRNEIFAFQNRGFAQILFNSRVQIPASDGMPIEITNGYKVQGKRYLSEHIGCTNKWSIASAPSGLYFLDNEKKSIYRFGESLDDLTAKFGFKTWLDEIETIGSWNPDGFHNLISFYDKQNGDIYFVSSDEALVFSETLGQFTSFMDYGSVPLMVNIDQSFYAITNGDNASNVLNLWEMWGGQYNEIFGEFKPFWLTFISNTDPDADKVFNTLDWRTITYTDLTSNGEQGILAPFTTFDTLRVWHDHQDTGDVSLTIEKDKPSILKKKFNVFRSIIPRDMRGDWSTTGRQRIRNTWTYIKLGRYQENYDYTVFSDLGVNFFE